MSSVNVYTIVLLILDLEQLEFVDKLPMPTESQIGLSSQSPSVFVGKMRFEVDQTDHSVNGNSTPSLLHKTSIQIRPQAD